MLLLLVVVGGVWADSVAPESTRGGAAGAGGGDTSETAAAVALAVGRRSGSDLPLPWFVPFRFCVRSFFFVGLVRGEGKLKVNLNFSARHDLS